MDLGKKKLKPIIDRIPNILDTGLEDDKIKVFDGTTLRVQLGNLA